MLYKVYVYLFDGQFGNLLVKHICCTLDKFYQKQIYFEDVKIFKKYEGFNWRPLYNQSPLILNDKTLVWKYNTAYLKIRCTNKISF